MKFLDSAPLDRLNDFFIKLNMGECTIKGCLEAYSCKHAGEDKKLYISLENEIIDYIEKSSYGDSSSLDEIVIAKSSRRTLVYLVLTLYCMYPDYDFRIGLRLLGGGGFLRWTTCSSSLMSNWIADEFNSDEMHYEDDGEIFADMDM